MKPSIFLPTILFLLALTNGYPTTTYQTTPKEKDNETPEWLVGIAVAAILLIIICLSVCSYSENNICWCYECCLGLNDWNVYDKSYGGFNNYEEWKEYQDISTKIDKGDAKFAQETAQLHSDIETSKQPLASVNISNASTSPDDKKYHIHL